MDCDIIAGSCGVTVDIGIVHINIVVAASTSIVVVAIVSIALS